MGLNKSKGNMYPWITNTWNTVKGACYHDCSYCYMKRWGQLNPVRFDESELKTNLGEGNFIFVGSSCDMFANDIPKEWIEKTLRKCKENPKNRYLFQTKNPERLHYFKFPKKTVFCTTIETNRKYEEIMRNSPEPQFRAYYLPTKSYITIEPIMDFDLKKMVALIKMNEPKQVNIGFNTSHNITLPEPSEQKTIELINELRKFTKVKLKSNSKRVIKDNSLYL